MTSGGLGTPEVQHLGGSMETVVAQLSQHTVDTPYMVGPVHCYAGELDGELVLFDTGPPTENCRRYLLENLDLDRLKHVIVTHCHIDHYGQSAWLEEHTGAAVYLPYRDILKIRHHTQRLEKMYELLYELGFREHYLKRLRESFHRGVLFPPFPESWLTAEADIPDRLGVEVIGCAGHSQSDLVYIVGSAAVTGDTLLRGIYQSPLLDVDLETGKRFNNYQAYCASIVRLSKLEDKRVLPGHRKSIESVEATLRFYLTKTLDRVGQLKPHIGKHTVAQIIELLFGTTMKDPFHVYLKASEIVFMKDFLERPDLLRKSLKAIGLFDQLGSAFEEAVAR